MARGFGPVWGSLPSPVDRIFTSVSAHSTAQTISLWLWFEASGRYALFKSQDTTLGYDIGNNYFYERRTWTSGNRAFNIPRGTINVWEHYFIVDTNNAPTDRILVFRNGVQVTASQFDTPDAPYNPPSGSLWVIGNDNTPTTAESWNGALGPIAVWSTAPSTADAQTMAQGLYRGAAPLRVQYSDSLQFWAELDSNTASEPLKGGRGAPLAPLAAVGAPLITGEPGGPIGVKAYAPWQFGSFVAPAATESSLTVVEATLGHTVVAPTETQLHILAPQVASQGNEATAPSLTERVNVGSAEMGHTAFAPPLYEPLDSQAATQGHTVAAPGLVVNATVALGASPEMGHTASPAGLSGSTLITSPANAETGLEVAAWELSAMPIGQWQVGTDDIPATASTTRFVLIQQNIADFEVSNATQGHTATMVDFAGALIPVSALAAHTADPVTLLQFINLQVTIAEAGHTVAAPTIQQPAADMGVLSATMGHLGEGFFTGDAVNLDQAQAQGVANAEQGTEVAAPTIFLVPNVPTPAERIFIPAAEDRVYTVAVESRTFAIAA